MEDSNLLKTDSISLRTHRAGDMERIVARHGQIYTQEYAWGKRVEEIVARITADFVNHYDSSSERCWIAERQGEFVGCVMLVNDRDAWKTAKLRALLVEPVARGLGIGSTLVQQCVQFATEVGYSRITAWTISVLGSARRIYEGAGFKLAQEEEHETLGVKLLEQILELEIETQ